MKNQKMNLGTLEVQSFITNLNNKEVDTVKGGKSNIICPRPKTYGCPSEGTVSCLPPKSDGCFTNASCPITETEVGN